jgi:hypothetical protein
MASARVKEQARRRPIILSAKILPSATVDLLIGCVGGCAVFLEKTNTHFHHLHFQNIQR